MFRGAIQQLRPRRSSACSKESASARSLSEWLINNAMGTTTSASAEFQTFVDRRQLTKAPSAYLIVLFPAHRLVVGRYYKRRIIHRFFINRRDNQSRLRRFSH